jgi:hypothetical protein
MMRIAIAALVLSSAAFAHEKDVADEHAGTTADCTKMFKGKERTACRACVKVAGNHFHKAKGDNRCHTARDARNPIEKAGDAIGGAVDDVAKKGGSAIGKGTDDAAKKAGEAGEKTHETVRKAGDKAGEAAERARAGPRDAGD